MTTHNDERNFEIFENVELDIIDTYVDCEVSEPGPLEEIAPVLGGSIAGKIASNNSYVQRYKHCVNKFGGRCISTVVT